MTFKITATGLIEPIPGSLGYTDWHYRQWSLDEVRQKIRNFSEDASAEVNGEDIYFKFEVKDWAVVKLEIIRDDTDEQAPPKHFQFLGFLRPRMKNIPVVLLDESHKFIRADD